MVWRPILNLIFAFAVLIYTIVTDIIPMYNKYMGAGATDEWPGCVNQEGAPVDWYVNLLRRNYKMKYIFHS